MLQCMTNTVLNAPAHSEKNQSRMLRNHFYITNIRNIGINHIFLLNLLFDFTICRIFICRFIFLLILFHIPLCNVRVRCTINRSHSTPCKKAEFEYLQIFPGHCLDLFLWGTVKKSGLKSDPRQTLPGQCAGESVTK